MSSRRRPEPAGLQHVLVAGGTPAAWWSMSPAAWSERLTMLADQASSAGATWLTVRPMGPDACDPAADPAPDLVRARDAVAPWPATPVEVGGVTVVVDAECDARHRFEVALRSLAARGVTAATLTESALAAALLHPAPSEPDLAVLLGSDDVLPSSLSWELAYAEVVYVDAPWADVDPVLVKAAVAEYFTRSRRFGGVTP